MNVSADWREDFLRLFLSGRPDDVSAAYALKQRSMPKTLFKFFAPSEYAFAGLCTGTVWLAAPSTFNDPFDSSLTLDSLTTLAHVAGTVDLTTIEDWSSLGLSHDDLVAFMRGTPDKELIQKLVSAAPESERIELRRVIEVVPGILATMMNEQLQRLQLVMQLGTKIACFTEQATSMLLWSHYAASHQGFCVEYDIESMPADVPQRHLLFPVYYKAARFDPTPRMVNTVSDPTKVPNHVIAAAIHKAPEWAYEHEWRIVNPDGSDLPGLSVPMARPRRVHAGARMTPVDRARLGAICQQIDIRVCDVRLSQHRYEIRLEGQT